MSRRSPLPSFLLFFFPSFLLSFFPSFLLSFFPSSLFTSFLPFSPSYLGAFATPRLQNCRSPGQWLTSNLDSSGPKAWNSCWRTDNALAKAEQGSRLRAVPRPLSTRMIRSSVCLLTERNGGGRRAMVRGCGLEDSNATLYAFIRLAYTRSFQDRWQISYHLRTFYPAHETR